MSEAIVAVEGVEIGHEGGSILLRLVHEGLGQDLVAQHSKQELLVVSASGHQRGTEVGATALVVAVSHTIRLHQVFVDDCMDVLEPSHCQGNSSRELQMVGVVRVDLARFPDELDVVVDGLRAIRDAAPNRVALLGGFCANFGSEPILQGRCAVQLGPSVGQAPVSGSSGVHLLPRLSISEAACEGQKHSKGHGRTQIGRVLRPPGEVLVQRVIQGLD
mmetsp:Transcript_56313/g.119857  ORF Transcript_56313/g.119857 Transcript_56313/m.119857 type:complete len:218 (+) Transcript_56313:687-1340(+)